MEADGQITPLSLKILNTLENVDEEVLDQLISRGSIIHFQSQKRTYNGELRMEDNKVYFLIRGRIFLSCINGEGKKIIAESLREGNFFGFLDSAQQRTEAGECLFVEPLPKTEALLLEFNREEFLKILSKYPILALKVLASVADRVSRLNQKIEALALDNLEGRLLKELKNLDGSRMTHEKLAEATGSVRETVSKVLSKLKKMGVVSYDLRPLNI